VHTNHPLAGLPAPAESLIDTDALLSAFYDNSDDLGPVAFGTSGHRGCATDCTFNERHILAITQAVCELRRGRGVDGPLHLGMDTHALSRPAFDTALRVLARNGVTVRIDDDDGFTPTPVVSQAILAHNRERTSGLADGIIITPSHNPPEHGGLKYNPPEGGPAGAETTKWIETRANALLAAGDTIAASPLADARAARTTEHYDYVTPYVTALADVVDLAAISDAGIRIGVDPLGGSGLAYWAPIAERYGLDLTLTNDRLDPQFAFMTLDHDGVIRMDCSSRFAMASLIEQAGNYDIAIGNDPDFDRHGVVAGGELMNPNHLMTVAVDYLLTHRPQWGPEVGIGKTLGSTLLIDAVAAAHGRRTAEMPVGFKWFVDGLLSGALGFAGEESAGASFLRFDGTVWTTDKDGFIPGLLAAEIMAKTGEDPAARYRALTAVHGSAEYARLDVPAGAAEKAAIARLSAENLVGGELAGDPITAVLDRAPGNGEAIGGVKVLTDRGWFAVRPSGTEAIYKIYAESRVDTAHLQAIQEGAQAAVAAAAADG
jgi:phosphoglucomutase